MSTVSTTKDEIATTCARHPKVASNLRCASCGTYICPKCLVQTPVGAKCRDCSSLKGVSLFSLSPLNAALACTVGLLAGAVAGWAVEFSIGFFALFLAFAYGGFAGEMIMRAAGRKRGVRMEVIAGVSMAVGAIGGRLAIAAVMLATPGNVHPPHGVLSVLVDLFPFPAIALVIAILAAVSRIRYI